MVLIKHMPRDSAVNRELFGEAAEWSVTDYLLAASVDHLAAGNWMFACVNAAEDSDPPDAPEPMPRPDGKPRSEADEESGPDADADPASAGADGVSPETLVRFFG
ncbi:hypothetical protein ACFXB3_16760 [Streptomyces sp. NPDC059447]|uniref:hypothetical protein n=1 Tax=unclassified Streptomyces TaxID=2593676 RepID=UPI0036BE1802